MMVVVSDFVLILSICYFIHFGYSYCFWAVLIGLSIIPTILIMTEFTKGILARLKINYKENEQKSRRVFIMQKFWGEIWYMSNLLIITFDRKIILLQLLRYWKLDFKSILTIYYMPNFDNRARNDVRLKFAEIVRIKKPTRIDVRPIFRCFNFNFILSLF